MHQITKAFSSEHFHQILQLQQDNLPISLSETERQKEGFVSVEHDLETLKQISGPFKHIIALDSKDNLIAYALVMLKDFSASIELLVPMFEKIDSTIYQGKTLTESNYFVMGQVCIAKGHRGIGLFKDLYDALCNQMKATHPIMITEVSHRNARSMRAHYKYGFEKLLDYQTATEKWELIVYDCSRL